MKKSTRTLSALFLAGALTSLAACGDDDSNGTTGDGGMPGVDGGTPPVTGNVDSATPPVTGNDGSTTPPVTGNDGGTTPPPAPAADCPASPLVESRANLCALIQGTLTENLTIGPVMNKQWLLDGRLIVGEDVGGEAVPTAGARAATLTILPGTTIYGSPGTLSYLVVSRGSKLIANGTQTAPIVFTTAAMQKRPSSWGGIAINGRARATCGTSCMSEGEAGLFGGLDDEDSSGSLQFVRVEWAGYEFQAGNELNGIAFNGVGRGTVVDHVQVHYNGDDGIEMFGGTVNIKHAVLTGNGDDNIDWQLGWRGKLQHAVVIQDPMTGDHGIEADNTEANADAEPVSDPVLANVTMIGNTMSSNDGIHLRRGTRGKLHSFLVTNFKRSCVNVTEDTHARLTVAPPTLTIAGSRVGCTAQFNNEVTGTSFFLPASGNMTLATPAEATALLRGVSITAPDPRLLDGSALLTGGSKVAGDAFFDQVDHIGAFNATDNWMAGWTSFEAATP